MQPAVPTLKNLRIGGEVIRLRQILTTDWDNVAEAALEIPGAIAYLSWHRGLQYQRVEERKRLVKEAESAAYFDLKNGEFEARGYGSKMTDAALKYAVVLDPGVKEASKALEKTQGLLRIYDGQLEALRARLDMVRTSEATRRRLIEGVPDDALKQYASQPSNEDQD